MPPLPIRGSTPLPKSYAPLLAELKDRVRAAQVKAALSVNREMILLYWEIGHRLAEARKREKWGSGVVRRLSSDLRAEFAGMSGFSERNLEHMARFAEAWPELPIAKQAVSELPWGHNVRLLQMLPERASREWYARKAIEHGWSRAILELQIETRLLLVRGQKNRLMVEYALRDISKPMGVAEWTARPAAELPKKLRDALPSVEQIEERLKLAEEE